VFAMLVEGVPGGGGKKEWCRRCVSMLIKGYMFVRSLLVFSHLHSH